MKTKIDIILELVRDGKVTNEEAKILMATEKEKEYIYVTSYPQYPYNPLWPTVTYDTSTTNGTDLFCTTMN